MIGKVCRNNQYQLKNKSNHVTNTSRVKCEIKRICDSHNILPSLITDCPHCKEILNTLQKRGNERGVIPDKLKPFIHNYTKLFCNQQILHRVIDKDSLTQKRAKVDKNKEKIDQNSSHDRHLKSSKMKQRFENMKESFWNFVDSDICKKRDKRESIETAQEKRERRHLKHKIRSETQSDNLTTNSQDSVTEEESTSASPKISSTKSRYCLLSKQSSIKHVERLWSKSLERKNQLKKDLSPNKSVRFSIVLRPNKRDHYVADKPQLVILSSATDAATNTSNGTSSILSDKEDNVQQRKNKQSSEKIKPDLEHFNLLGNVNNNCDESPKNKNNRDNDLEEKTEKLKYRNATYGTNSKSLVSLKNSLKPGKLTQNSMDKNRKMWENLQKKQTLPGSCRSCRSRNRSKQKSPIQSRPYEVINSIEKLKKCAQNNVKDNKKWKKYEVNNATKVELFKVERVQKPLEPLLSKIIHPGDLSNTKMSAEPQRQQKQSNSNKRNSKKQCDSKKNSNKK
ncbi:hypothetical protein M8J75_005806 [Diaphorina citri]|nr:hypothetical protein M8J75_005806 [Diaphorina citri]